MSDSPDAIAAIEKIWSAMLSEPDDVVVDRVCERVEESVGFRPDAAHVSQVLRGARNLSPHRSAVSTVPRTNLRAGVESLPNPGLRAPGGSGKYALVLEGQTWRFRFTRDALVFAFEWFARRDKTFLERFSTRVRGHTVRYVARDPSQIYRNQPERGHGASAPLPGGWWIVVKNSTTRKENLIRRGCELAGLRYGTDVIFDFPTRHRQRAAAPPPPPLPEPLPMVPPVPAPHTTPPGAMRRRQLVMAALEAGEETERCEFKSSAFYSYRPNVPQKTIFEASVLKPVAGFLNANGGLLLIGVDDDARPIGIQKDLDLRKWAPEKYVRHLTDRIGQEMGQAAAACVRVGIATVLNWDICVVEVDPSPDPVWLTKAGKSGKRKVFYARMNNSTRELRGPDLLGYSRKRWD